MGDARPKSGYSANTPGHSQACHRAARAPRRTAAAMLLAAIGLTLTGCAHANNRTAGFAPDRAAQATRAGADRVCARFATAALSSDTVIDHDPSDARRRAAQLYGTSALEAQFVGQSGADPQWPTLVAHEASVSVRTSPVDDDPPPITANETSAGVVAHPTAHGAHAWTQTLPDVVVYCTLGATGPSWTVTAVTFSGNGVAPAASTAATR